MGGVREDSADEGHAGTAGARRAAALRIRNEMILISGAAVAVSLDIQFPATALSSDERTGFTAVVLLFALLAVVLRIWDGLTVGSRVESGIFLTRRIPLRALFDPNELGAITPSEVRTVQSLHLGSETVLHVRGRGLRVAVFNSGSRPDQFAKAVELLSEIGIHGDAGE